MKLLETAVRQRPNVRLKVESLPRGAPSRPCCPGATGGYAAVLVSHGEGKVPRERRPSGADRYGRVCLARRAAEEDAILPWSVIGTTDMDLLREEYERAFGGREEDP